MVFRTVDNGGDKALPYLNDIKDEAENPARGWRALRLSLERSTLMKAQARALIDAAAGRTLRVMFPMVSEPWEYEEARALFEEQLAWSKKAKRPMPLKIEYGAMLEVPPRRDAHVSLPGSISVVGTTTTQYCSPPTAPIRDWPSATTGSARRSCASFAAS